MLTLTSQFTFLCVVAPFTFVAAYNLVSPPVTEYKKVGPQESVSFSCKVQGDDYSIVHDPIEFTKKQGDAEEVLVSVLANLRPPFETTSNRYKISYRNQNTPIMEHELLLNISGLTVDDSGEYKCRIGANGASVVHHLYVIDDVKSLKFFGSEDSTRLWNALAPAENSLIYGTASRGMIQCVAQGGYPPPTLSMYLGNQQVTGDFDYNTTCDMEGTDVGLQRFQCVTTRGTQNFRATSAMNGQILRCVSHQHDLVPDQNASVQLNIKGIPRVIEEQCPNVVYASKGDTRVILSCLFISNPGPTSVSWKVDISGSAVTSNNPKTRFSAVTLVMRNGLVEANLTIEDLRSDDFHSYILQVTNEMGQMEDRLIELQESNVGSVSKGSCVSPRTYTHIILTLLCVFLSTHLYH